MGDTGSLFLGGAVAALGFTFGTPLILIPVGIIYIAEDALRHHPGDLFQGHPRQAVFQNGPAAPPPGALRVERGEAGGGVLRHHGGVLRAGVSGHVTGPPGGRDSDRERREDHGRVRYDPPARVGRTACVRADSLRQADSRVGRTGPAVRRTAGPPALPARRRSGRRPCGAMRTAAGRRRSGRRGFSAAGSGSRRAGSWPRAPSTCLSACWCCLLTAIGLVMLFSASFPSAYYTTKNNDPTTTSCGRGSSPSWAWRPCSSSERSTTSGSGAWPNSCCIYLSCSWCW